MTKNHIDTIKSIVEEVKFAMLTTITEEGHLHSQPMTTLDSKALPGEIWFIGSKASDCVKNIAQREQVNLAYYNNGDYVSINGKAHLIDDRSKLEALWSDSYTTFFEQGIDDPNIQLICVRAHGAEYWQSPSTLKTHFEFAKAAVTGESIDGELGENYSIEF